MKELLSSELALTWGQYQIEVTAEKINAFNSCGHELEKHYESDSYSHGYITLPFDRMEEDEMRYTFHANMVFNEEWQVDNYKHDCEYLHNDVIEALKESVCEMMKDYYPVEEVCFED